MQPIYSLNFLKLELTQRNYGNVSRVDALLLLMIAIRVILIS